MPIFMCEKCGKQFSHKGTFERHQNRKYSCVAVLDYHKNGNKGGMKAKCTFDHIGLKKKDPLFEANHGTDCYKMGQNQKVLSMVSMGVRNDKMIIPSSSSSSKYQATPHYENTTQDLKNKPTKKDITISCFYCKSNYKNQFTLKRHMKTCKMIPITKGDINSIEASLNSRLQNVLTSKISNCTQNYNTINNNTINNTINNQNIIFVDSHEAIEKLLPFGKEDLEFLTHDMMKNIISQPEQGIIKLIQQVHFNDEIPQNQNIQMTNKKDPYVEVFNGEKWEKQDKKTAIQNIITTKKDIMDDYFDEQVEKNILSKFIKKNYETFSDMLDDYVRESLTHCDDSIKTRVIRKCLRLYREICKQAEILLINNKKKTMKQLEKKENQQIECGFSDEEDI